MDFKNIIHAHVDKWFKTEQNVKEFNLTNIKNENFQMADKT